VKAPTLQVSENMSRDLQIAYACPHYIRYERVGLQNGMYVIPASPINGSGMVELRRDGVVLNQEGNIKEALLTTPNVSPFRVRSNSNILTIKTTEGYENTITVPTKIYKSKSLIEILQPVLGSIVIKEDNKSLTFTDDKLGIGYTLSGSFLKALGFDNQKQFVKTKKTTPSWNLYPRINGYDIKFGKTLEPEGLLEISYTTEKRDCRRCSSTGVENDIRFNGLGELQKVQDTDLLYQNIAKTLLTEMGSNPYHSWYGSNANRLIGQKNNAALGVSLRLSVQQALDKFQSVQQDLKKVQDISLEERLISVQSVEVSQLNGNATAVLCKVVVKSGANKPVSVNIVFSVPGAISLDGELT
jgi:phage baseplate assembly protein W